MSSRTAPRRPTADHIAQAEVLLAIPTRHALGPSTRQDFGIVDEADAVVRYEQESIGSDLWTTRDTVGYGEHVDAIARGISMNRPSPR